MNYILTWQFILRRESAYAIAKVVGSETGGKSHNELISEEIKRAVRDFYSKFPANKAVSIIMPANSGFSGVLLFPFYTLLLNHFLQV